MAKDNLVKIGGELKSVAPDGIVADALAVKDYTQDKTQGTINGEVQTALNDRYTKEQTYTKAETNALITTPDVEYVTVSTYSALPAEGSADTIYRVSSWDGSQVDATKYTLYAWNGSGYTELAVRSSVGEVFDISEYHASGGTLATYADLAAALGTGGANVPEGLRKGGMSVKFVQTSDNNYVQFRYMPSDAATVATFTNTANWQGVDVEPILDSKNLVESGGVVDYVNNEILPFRLYLDEQEIYSEDGKSFTSTEISNWPYHLSILSSNRQIASLDAVNGRALKFKVKAGAKIDVTGFQWGDSAIIGFSSNLNFQIAVGSTFDSVIAGMGASYNYQFSAPQDGIVVICVHKNYNASIKIKNKISYTHQFVEKVSMSIGIIYQGRTIATPSLTDRWNMIYSRLIKNDGIVTQSISGLSFACFKNGAWYGDYSTIPSDCEYFRIYKTYNSKLTPQPIELHYSNNNGCLTYLKDSYRIEEEYDRTYFNWFSCDVALPINNPQTDIEDAEPLFTNAWIKLPKSYSRTGTPTKMIILCHGTTGMSFTSFNESYRTPVEYFNSQGYAVMDCYPLSSLYPNSSESVAAHSLGVACYQAAYDYIVKNYNIAPDVCVYAKSAGGITQGNIINQSNIPVRGAAILCPNLDLFNDFRCMYPATSQYRMEIYNLTPLMTTEAWTTEQSAVLKNNQLAFVGFSPILYHNTIDAKAYNDFLLNRSYPLATSITKSYSQDLLNDSDFSAIVDDAQLFTKCPVKIWYAEDDNQVPYVTIVKYQKMVQNGGGVCILRQMPDGTGGHGSADNSELAETVTVTARDGSSWTIAKGIVEALQWIELFIG